MVELSKEALEKAQYFVDIDPQVYLAQAISAAIEHDGFTKGVVVEQPALPPEPPTPILPTGLPIAEQIAAAVQAEQDRIVQLLQVKVASIKFRKGDNGKIDRNDPLNKQLAVVKVYLKDVIAEARGAGEVPEETAIDEVADDEEATEGETTAEPRQEPTT